MRAAATTLLLALLLMPGLALAEASPDGASMGTVATLNPAASILCEVSLQDRGEDPDTDWYTEPRRFKSSDTHHVRTDEEQCEDLFRETIFQWDAAWDATSIEGEAPNNHQPITPEIGWSYYRLNVGWGTDSHTYLTTISTDGRPISAPPSDTYSLQKGAFCSEKMHISFSQNTNQIDLDANDFFIDLDTTSEDDAFKACSGTNRPLRDPDNAPHKPPHRNSGSIDLKKFQGWQMSSTNQDTYGFPLYCDKVKFSISTTVGNDGECDNSWWREQQGTTDSKQIGEANQVFFQDGNNEDYYKLTLHGEQGKQRIDSITLEMEDQSNCAGGFKYELTCVDPLGPEENEDVCNSVGDWQSDEETDNGGLCCYEDSEYVGQTVSFTDGTPRYCGQNDEGAYEWTEDVVEACGEDDAGGRVKGDDEYGYCCIADSEYTDQPHLRGTSGWSEQARGFYCDSDGTFLDLAAQDTYKKDTTWLYTTDGWTHCGPGDEQTRAQYCNQTTTPDGQTYTCGVTSRGWEWVVGDDHVARSDEQEWGNLTAGAQESHAQLQELIDAEVAVDAVMCTDGTLAEGNEKHSQPLPRSPRIRTGYCPEDQCYAYGNEDADDCVEAGTIIHRYECRQAESGAVWASRTAQLAQHLLEKNKPGGDYLLNCGPAPVSTNDDAPSGWGYCQLAALSGQEPEEILLAATYPTTEESTAKTHFLEQVQTTHEETYDPDLHSPDYAYYDEAAYENTQAFDENTITGTIAYFTSDDSLSGGTLEDFWGWLSGLFTQQEDVTLLSESAHKLYVLDTGEEQQWAVEYVSEDECSTERVIIKNDGTSECYTDAKWREVIHTR